MFSTGRRLLALEARLGEHRVLIDQLIAQVHAGTPATLKAQIADLAAAVEVDRTRMRRELGRLWRDKSNDQGNGAAVVAPDELKALLDLQNAHKG